ncbi:hypothetical protein WDW37_20225 [Bdellovibrionota bacterium FG-1]
MKFNIILLAVALGAMGTGCTKHSTSSTEAVDSSGTGVTVSEPTTQGAGTEITAPAATQPETTPTAAAAALPTPLLPMWDITVGTRHACALDSKNQVWCWGDNTNKQLGNLTDPKTLKSSSTPVYVDISVNGSKDKVISLAAGGNFTCAIVDPLVGGKANVTNQKAVCWGADSTHYNTFALGVGSSSSVSSNQYVQDVGTKTDLANVTQLAPGNSHACALLRSLSVYCWGSGGSGSLGIGTTFDYTAATFVTAGVGQLSTSHNTTCAKTTVINNKILKCNGYCWGANDLGQIPGQSPTSLLKPTSILSTSPTMFTLLSDSKSACQLQGGALACYSGLQAALAFTIPSIDSAYLGGGVSCTLTAGIAKCWGSVLRGISKLFGTYDKPKTLSSQSVTHVAVGDTSACLIANGKAQCFGQNSYGQLGNGTNTNSVDPVEVVGL